MLLHLVSDYLRNVNGVQDRFARDPFSVIKEYGLSAEEVKGFDTPAQLAARMSTEVAGVTGSALKALWWGIMDMTIDKVVPNTGDAGKTLTLKVIGDGFTPAVKVAFQQPGEPQVSATQVRFVDAQTLDATVVLSSPGSYAVRVWEDTTPPHGGSMDGAIEISK